MEDVLSDVFTHPQKERMPHLPFRGLGAVINTKSSCSNGVRENCGRSGTS